MEGLTEKILKHPIVSFLIYFALAAVMVITLSL
jgi:hypothetical protein